MRRGLPWGPLSLSQWSPAPAGLLLPTKSSLSPTASPACQDGRPPGPAGSTPCPSRLRMSPCSSITPQQVQAWARHAGVSHTASQTLIQQASSSRDLKMFLTDLLPGCGFSFSFHKPPVPERGGLVSRAPLDPKVGGGSFPSLLVPTPAPPASALCPGPHVTGNSAPTCFHRKICRP